MAAGISFRRDFIRASGIAGAATLLTGFAWPSQKKKQKQQDDSDAILPPAALGPVEDQLNQQIGEMLGAWQVGDTAAMHKYYDDNATFVSGAYEPPVIGWQKYLVAYQRQKARIQAMQFVRKNTVIMTKGDLAWAMYQWQFDAVVDGQPFADRGQTTLVFAQQNDRWMIVHNHTSEICTPPAPSKKQPEAAPLQNPSAQNPGAQKPTMAESPKP